MKKLKNRQQKGFSILSVILVIVAVIVAIGIWTFSGQVNTSNTGTTSLDMQASTILNDSAAIKLAYDNLVIKGASPSSIVFIPNTASTNSAPNILDPATGIQVPKVNVNSVRASPSSSQGFWVLDTPGIYGRDIGTNAGRDIAILITGLKPEVCQRINYMLYGSTSMVQVVISSTNWFTNGATTANPMSGQSSLDLSSNAFSAVSGWTAGCVSITGGSGDDTAFFRILQAY